MGIPSCPFCGGDRFLNEDLIPSCEACEPIIDQALQLLPGGVRDAVSLHVMVRFLIDAKNARQPFPAPLARKIGRKRSSPVQNRF
ncbi:hypothetical protein EOA37_09645 [Mesorhizobium sp. M2A.F.Ca.ET.015.02.1.1]|uniref:hypothetical protein n=1 Tax=Mesorhizobium sp. M2A.F.Ca.ET.015.02.1.1 TaxID=2496758 RepID=UPI000FC9EEF5|nr:hypothetical protein [Mesorhizobium sp. M2A.F.Ca.ET.015.02.1.1]RUW41515.1 hypothetical protein EOA37_09645 [Mesorhizobium sp. M2A.F.Ca.ET.015.02.1.1]